MTNKTTEPIRDNRLMKTLGLQTLVFVALMISWSIVGTIAYRAGYERGTYFTGPSFEARVGDLESRARRSEKGMINHVYGSGEVTHLRVPHVEMENDQ